VRKEATAALRSDAIFPQISSDHSRTLPGGLKGRLRQADDTEFPATDRQIESNMIGDDTKSNAMCIESPEI